MKLVLPIAIILYALGGVCMFGTIYHRTECFKYEGESCPSTKAAGALISAIAWPLSLSVIIQEQK